MKSFVRVFIIAYLLLPGTIYAQKINLKWMLHPESGNHYTISQLSQPGFVKKDWINAVVPGTVFYAYVKAGKELNPDFADNIYKVDKAKYDQPFWYRTEFSAASFPANKRIRLNFNGIHKRGEIYVNGYHVGTIKGIVERGIYDITDILRKKSTNVILVLVVPPRHDPEHNHPLANWESPTYISSGSWDWMPAVPGLNSGITDTVSLAATGPVTVEDPWVQSSIQNKNAADLKVNLRLKNTSAETVTGVVKLTVNPGNIVVTGPKISVYANSAQIINYNQEQFPQLHIKNPELWWPNGYGGKPDGTQHLYTLTASFEADGQVSSDVVTKNFGIRKITSDTTTLNGPLRLYVNDVPILIKGGNWGMSDYMLKARGKDYETRVRFHQDMNFNMIRNWTGEVTDEAFYEYCDKYGIMVWDDFWLNNYGKIAYITFSSNQSQMLSRLEGYHKALEESAYKPFVKEIEFNRNDDLIIGPITAFLKKNKNLDAVFFGTNHVGTCGLKVITDLGIKVPSDLAVVSFDDYNVFKLHSPPVTAIAQPIEAIADNVITVLLNRLNTSSQHISSQSIILKTDLNIRASSKMIESKS